jgi:hypothetical protein
MSNRAMLTATTRTRGASLAGHLLSIRSPLFPVQTKWGTAPGDTMTSRGVPTRQGRDCNAVRRGKEAVSSDGSRHDAFGEGQPSSQR